MKYHINPDGKVPCTNCGREINLMKLGDLGGGLWLHKVGNPDRPPLYCYDRGLECACPEPPNDDEEEYEGPDSIGSIGDTEAGRG